MPPDTESPNVLAPLSDVHARILGCLIEKEATTPEGYPLTANSLVLACNQKTARDPLMELNPAKSAMPCGSWNPMGSCAPSMARAPSVTSIGSPKRIQ